MDAQRPALGLGSRDAERQRGLRMRGLWWTVLAGLILGAVGFWQPVEDSMRAARNKLHTDKASGDIVLVAIDDRSLRELHNWPWPRSYHAKMLDRLSDAGARRVFFDIIFSSPSAPEEDQAFADALRRSQARVTLPTTSIENPLAHEASEVLPLELFRESVDVASISIVYSFQNAVWDLSYGSLMAGEAYPSFASSLARVSTSNQATFRVDYSIDPATVPTISAVDVLNGQAPRKLFAGKDVIIGTTSEQLNDMYFIPGHGLLGGVYIHTLGAETLKTGRPLAFGWFPAFTLAVLAAAVAFHMRSIQYAILLLGTVAVSLVGFPVWADHKLIFFDVIPGIFVLLATVGVLAWSRLRQRAALNAVSGLPNLDSLRSDRSGGDRPLIAARVSNYAEIVASLPPEEERAFVGQIATRLSVGAPGRKIFHGDDGLFVWFGEPESNDFEHLDALCALFRSPVLAAGASIDVAINFGVDEDCERSLANRLGSALVAADEAAQSGVRWKLHDPASLRDAAWRLSLLGQLDTAIEAGDLWVAYQPKLDLRTGRITGAEALVRWTHPTKGSIGPMEFIPAAEQSDRIERLTYFVLERAIAAAAVVTRREMSFGIAVNLSARLLDQASLPKNVANLLKRHGLPPNLLTLEITETAALSGDHPSLDRLRQLRSLGVTISIDDYGTGQSTLEYLKKVPATEIKIDQNFVQAMCRSKSDRLLVHSTIQLAHSLGQTVVAEGIEDEATLASLVQMGCDYAQGYFIGRPMTFRALSRRLLVENRREAA